MHKTDRRGSTRQRTIPGTSVALTEISFGDSVIGNLYGATSDDEAAAAVAAAWDAGVRDFDTAPHYGLGLSERRLGSALAAYRRDDVVSAKVDRLLLATEHPAGVDPEGFAVPDDLRRSWDFSTLPAAAIAFPLTRPAIITGTLGMRSSQQVGRNAELHRAPVRDGLWSDLRAPGLISPGVPTAAGRVRCH